MSVPFKFAALAAATTMLAATAQADVTIDLGDFDFSGGQAAIIEMELTGTLTGWEVSFDFLGNTDASWSSDAMFGVVGANGNGIEVGGYDMTFGLPYIGVTGTGSSAAGSFSHSYTEDFDGLPLSSYNVGGTGTWTLLVGDGWSGGTQITSYHNVVFTLYGVDAVPAPGAMALLGLAGLVGSRRRRSN